MARPTTTAAAAVRAARLAALDGARQFSQAAALPRGGRIRAPTAGWFVIGYLPAEDMTPEGSAYGAFHLFVSVSWGIAPSLALTPPSLP